MQPWWGRNTARHRSDAILSTRDAVPWERSLPSSDIEAGPDPLRPSKPGLPTTIHGIISKLLVETGTYASRDRAYAAWVHELTALPPGDGGLVVDLGCGHGRMLSTFRGRGRLLGIELRRPHLMTFADPSIPRLQGDAEHLPLQEGSVDVLLALSLVEHLPHQEAFFDEVARVLRDGGIGILQIPNLRYFIEPHTKWPLFFLWNEPVRRWVLDTLGGEGVNVSTTLDSVVRLARDAGLSVDRVFPIWHVKIARLLRVPMGHFLVLRRKTPSSAPLGAAVPASTRAERSVGPDAIDPLEIDAVRPAARRRKEDSVPR